jgi:hypothetical protein
LGSVIFWVLGWSDRPDVPYRAERSHSTDSGLAYAFGPRRSGAARQRPDVRRRVVVPFLAARAHRSLGGGLIHNA